MMNLHAQKPAIFIFSTVYLPMIGGAELALKEITDRLSSHYEFILFTARMSRAFPARERLGVIEVRRLGFGFKIDKYFLPLFGFWAAWRETKIPAVLWGMMASFGSIGAYFFKRNNPAIPFLLTLQEGDPEQYLLRGRWGLMGWWLRRLARRADRIQTISFYLKRLAVKAGASFNGIDVVPNGVDLSLFGREYPDARKELYDRFHIPSDAKIAITASRLVHKNGVDMIIRAMERVPNEHLIVAGTGPEEALLRKLARDLGVEARVHFALDLTHPELARYYSVAYVFVRPSRSEGLGSAFLEAMAAGLPVIATNVGGIPDFLTHNETGVFVKVDDPLDIAYQLKHIFYDAPFREKIGQNARALALSTYSWDRVADRINQIFYRLIFA